MIILAILNMRYCLIIIIVLSSIPYAVAQRQYYVQYASPTGKVITLDFLANVHASKLAAVAYMPQAVTALQANGYITAAIDTVLYGTDTARVQLYLGEQFKWGKLGVQYSEPKALASCGYNAAQPLQYAQLLQLQNKLLTYYQEQGHPFVSIKLDSFALLGNTITAQLITHKGQLYTIDSIRLYGNVTLANHYLQKQLNIANGSTYKKSVLDAIPKRIQDLNFVQAQYPYSLTMLAQSAVVNVYLQPRKSSVINVLLGVIPAPNPNGLAQVQSNKLFLSGDANILLNNTLGTGETMALVYQQLSINSRRIQLQYRQPYVFKTDYTVDAGFEIYKRDSSYLNLDIQSGVAYNVNANTTGRAYVQYTKTNTFPDTAAIRLTRRLNDNIDIKLLNVGVDYILNTTDYRRNPRRGKELHSTLSFGRKVIGINSGVVAIKDPNFDFSKLYDTIKKNTYQLKLKLHAASYYKLAKQSVLKLGIQSGLLLSQNYFRNELFQIGGFKILRGFDEESQFCNQYAVGTVEYRLLTGADSYLLAFVDGGYTANSIGTTYTHTYLGTGVGLNLATKSGIFNISFAVGTRNDIPLGFKQAKLHFGYVNVF